MKCILKGKNNFNNPIQTVLDNRGITIDLFKVDSSVIEDYDNYDNMEIAVETLISHIHNKFKIVILVDEDADGITSSAILYNYIRKVFEYDNITYIMHTKKAHGLSDDIIIPSDAKLILIPDASSNDYEQHLFYKEKGIDIIVLDHHPADKISENAIVVNNRLSKNVKNKQLAGVGVTYKFLKALDDYMFEDHADYYLDLVALGCIADVMDLKEPETRYYCYKGIKQVNNTFLKALLDKNAYDLGGKYNIDKVGWTIAPKINGTIRSATFEVKENMFKAFISDDYEFALETADACKKAKSNQDTTVKNILPKIIDKIDMIQGDKCIILEAPSKMESAHVGLVANKLQDMYGVPILLYKRVGNGNISGSTRSNPNISINLKSDLLKSGLFNWCEGQPNAHGFETKEDNIEKIKQYLNNLYKDKEIINGKTYEVDFIMEEDNINLNVINELAEYEDEWGNGISAPLILFKNVTICIENDNIKRPNMIFEIDGIKFIKKFLTTVLKDSVLNKGFLFVDIVGKVSNNIYNGRSTPQIEVVDINILE